MHDDTDPPAGDAPAGETRADSPVGYRRPPVHAQFRPGRSGNPAGRPKGSRNLATLLQAELRRPVTVTEGGRTRRIAKAAAMVTSQVNKALKGDTRAFNSVMQATRPRGGGDGGDMDAAMQAELEAAPGKVRELLERRLRRMNEESERLAAALAAAGVAREHVDLLFGPQGDRLHAAMTAALQAAHAHGFDVREIAELSVLPDAAEECADALLGETGGR